MGSSILTGIEAHLITNPVNIRYLTGFVGLAPDERESYAIVTPGKLYLLTNALYMEQAQKVADSQQPVGGITVHEQKIVVIEISRDNPLSAVLKSILDETCRVTTQPTNLQHLRLGFEETDITYAEHQKLSAELPDTNFIPTQNRIELLRQVKLAHEIAAIKTACKITDACFKFIINKLKPGVTESEIAWEIETFFHKNGAESAFPPIVAFDGNSSQPHYSCTRSDLRQGTTFKKTTIILLDFGAKFQGYCADMTRVVFLGKPDPEIERAYKGLKNAQKHALDLLTNGERSGAKLDQAVRDELAKSGYPSYPHSLGHSVGLAIHEGPRLSIRRDETLKPGMVFSVEPGIYVEGKFGIRIEDLVLITENGIEILSKSSKELIIF